MASFGRLTAALLGVSQENTFALANINFDFAIVKFEAPAEYKGLGESLSKRRKTAAEDGALHKVARKLGALFETEIPDVPHLIKAYGTRASEIAKLPRVNSSEAAAYGAFADYVGADGTTIWASATSGKNFVTIHLLACMLARIWTRQEAISIWSELVEERKEVLSNKTLDSSFRIADAVASRIELNRNELADWDASARAWLKTADDAQRVRQTQLRLIMDNVSLPVSRSSNVHSAVLGAWKHALRAMNDLVSGKSLRIQSGDVLLGLSAWHLYPDISVQSPQPSYVSQKDTLISPGGIVTVGLLDRGEQSSDEGFYWSLPLSHLKHYGDPVQATRYSGLSESDVTYDQFLFVILGSVLSCWEVTDQDLENTVKLFADLDDAKKVLDAHPRKSRPHKDQTWLSILARAARTFGQATGPTKAQYRRLITFGQRKCSNFLCPPKLQPAPFFGSCDLRNLMNIFSANKDGDFSNDERVMFLRQWTASTCQPSFLQDAIIEFATGAYDRLRYVYVLPGNKKRKRDKPEFIGDSTVWTSSQIRHYGRESEIEEALQRRRRTVSLPTEPGNYSGKNQNFYFLCGVPGIAAVYIPKSRIQKGDHGDMQHNQDKFDPDENHMSLPDFSSLLDTSRSFTAMRLIEYLCDPFQWQIQRERYPDYYHALDQLVVLDRIFSAVPGAQVNLGAIFRPLTGAAWSRAAHEVSRDGVVPLPIVFSCIIYYESGYLDLGPERLVDALALTNQNSIYVASQLLVDPGLDLPEIPIRRIIGNIGKSGISILVPPINPKVLQKDLESWNVVAHERFDGKMQDSFQASSLHLSLTGYELDVDQVGVLGNQDHDAKIVEVAISLHDHGKWIADLDTIKASKTWAGITYRHIHCNHKGDIRLDASKVTSLVSVDTWMELLDQPLVNCIVRANGNAIARLAAASLAAQKLYDYRIVSSTTCWACVAAEMNPKPSTIFKIEPERDKKYDSDSMEDSDAEEWGEGQSSAQSSSESEEGDDDMPTGFLPKDQESNARLVFIC